jgi:uncharacterized RDD family membrane protein YckC
MTGGFSIVEPASPSSGKEKIQLKFEPLTDGLGFHPFSDGLPYAPTSTTPTSSLSKVQQAIKGTSGAGAVAAGPASYVVPASATRSRVSVPVAAPKPVLEPRAPAQPLAPAAHRIRTSTAQPSVAVETRFERSFGFVYLIKRVLAYILDTALNSALCITALSMALVNQNIPPEELFSPGVALLAILFVSLFSWALITAQEVAFATSVGKRVFGLAIQGGASAAFLRAFFFLPSAGFCGLGLLWAIFDRRKRCWHDLVVDSQPIEIARI